MPFFTNRMDSTQYLTKEKRAELEKELDFLKKTRRKEIADSLEYAKSLGDLSENAEYHQAREQQAAVEDRISKVENILISAEAVPERHADTVGVGSTVVVKKEGGQGEQTFRIVGSEEADVTSGKISHASPLGSTLMGKRKGDDVKVATPKGAQNYSVVSVG